MIFPTFLTLLSLITIAAAQSVQVTTPELPKAYHDFSAIANLPDCSIEAPKVNPYAKAIEDGLPPHQAYLKWLEYYAKLPKQCFPEPFWDAVKSGKDLEEAGKFHDAFEHVVSDALFNLKKPNPYLDAIKRGDTPAKAYLHWIKSVWESPVET